MSHELSADSCAFQVDLRGLVDLLSQHLYSSPRVFLATIGNSSKRDDLAGARREFLGQFGIGLLACFTVADQIRVVTRSAREADAPTIEWLACSDGTYGCGS